jgi:hypothetical protein
MIKKFAIITIFYTIFTFVFLEVAWGKEVEAGESAQLETNLQFKEASPSPHFDLRTIKLRKFLINKNSSLADYTTFLIEKADEYKIDWTIFPAIAGVESGFCQAYIKSTNNCVGWGGGYIAFPSINKQIEVVLASLKENYIDQGLTTIELIGTKYAADPSWNFKVQRYMNAIEGTEIL